MLSMDTIGYYQWINGDLDNNSRELEQLADDIIYSSLGGRPTEVTIKKKDIPRLKKILERRGADFSWVNG